MKVIELKTAGNFSTKQLLQQICSGSPQGMNLTQMRSRIRVLDVLDAAADDDETISLEDADYSTVTEAINSTQWMAAHRDLLAIIDGILNLPKPEKKLRAVE